MKKRQFKAGDKVRRTADNRGPWWNKVCMNHGKKPDATFEVLRANESGVFLKGLEEGYEYTASFFELVKDDEESEMEKAYARAKSLIGKKITSDGLHNGYTVTGVIFRQDKTDNVGLSHVCRKFLEDNGWVVGVGVKFHNMNYPVQLVNEVPSEVSITLNSKYTAVVSKDGVKVGCQIFPIEKIKEIIDAHNKL